MCGGHFDGIVTYDVAGIIWAGHLISGGLLVHSAVYTVHGNMHCNTREHALQHNNNGPKTLLCDTHDTMSTSLLQQPITITCCVRFDRNYVSFDNNETPTDRADHIENCLLVRLINSCVEIILPNLCLLPTLQCTFQWIRHTKVHHRYPHFSNKQTMWLAAHHCVLQIV